MSDNPWTVVGWIVAAILSLGIVVALIGLATAVRAQRRIVRDWKNLDAEHDRLRREVRGPLRSNEGRFK